MKAIYKEYANKLMRIYELNAEILSDHDRWQGRLIYKDEETKTQIEACCKDIFGTEMP